MFDHEMILQKAIDTYGADAQEWMAIEEMSELAKEICKNKRGKDNREEIADEIADVKIMLAQLEMIFGVQKEVEKHYETKIDRLNQRLRMGG